MIIHQFLNVRGQVIVVAHVDRKSFDQRRRRTSPRCLRLVWFTFRDIERTDRNGCCPNDDASRKPHTRCLPSRWFLLRGLSVCCYILLQDWENDVRQLIDSRAIGEDLFRPPWSRHMKIMCHRIIIFLSCVTQFHHSIHRSLPCELWTIW